MLLDSIRRRLKQQARKLAELERAMPSQTDRLTAYRNDPARLMIDAGFTPDAWQSEFLRSTDLLNLILCARQIGKSLVVSVLALHTALTKPGSTVVVIAPIEPQANEL